MKAKVTPRHADSSDPEPWLAQLRDAEARPGPGYEAELAPDRALTRPYVGLPGGYPPAGGRPGSTQPAPKIIPGQAVSPEAGTWPQEGRGHIAAEPESAADDSPAAIPPAARRRDAAQVTGRAVIGDELRKPALWCQLGTCVARYAHPEALGEADNRSRAMTAGWREDALGRFACPSCLQRSAEFRVRYPVVPWEKDRAVAMAILMTVAVRQYRAADPAADTGWIPAIRPGSGDGAGRGGPTTRLLHLAQTHRLTGAPAVPGRARRSAPYGRQGAGM